MDILQLQEHSLKQHFFTSPFTVQDAGISYRELSYWEQKGLLPFEVKNHKWRRFNLPELIWLRLVVRLRDFGIGIPQIAQIKERLTEKVTMSELNPDWELMPQVNEMLDSLPLSPEDRSLLLEKMRQSASELKVTRFELFILAILQHGGSFKVVISRDHHTNGENPFKIDYIAIPRTTESIEIKGMPLLLESDHVTISLTDLMDDILLRAPLKKLNTIFSLSDQEQKALELLRSGKYSSIEIRFHNKKMHKILATETLPLNKDFRITDLVTRNGYHDLVIKTADGKVVHLEKTTVYKMQP